MRIISRQYCFSMKFLKVSRPNKIYIQRLKMSLSAEVSIEQTLSRIIDSAYLPGTSVGCAGNAETAGLDIAGLDIEGLDITGLDNGGLDNDGRMCAQATVLKLQNVRMTETDALRVVHCY